MLSTLRDLLHRAEAAREERKEVLTEIRKTLTYSGNEDDQINYRFIRTYEFLESDPSLENLYAVLKAFEWTTPEYDRTDLTLIIKSWDKRRNYGVAMRMVPHLDRRFAFSHYILKEAAEGLYYYGEKVTDYLSGEEVWERSAILIDVASSLRMSGNDGWEYDNIGNTTDQYIKLEEPLAELLMDNFEQAREMGTLVEERDHLTVPFLYEYLGSGVAVPLSGGIL